MKILYDMNEQSHQLSPTSSNLRDCFSKSITPREDVVDKADVDTCFKEGNVLSLKYKNN